MQGVVVVVVVVSSCAILNDGRFVIGRREGHVLSRFVTAGELCVSLAVNFSCISLIRWDFMDILSLDSSILVKLLLKAD